MLKVEQRHRDEMEILIADVRAKMAAAFSGKKVTARYLKPDARFEQQLREKE